jgi:hypothetical protein
MIPSKPLLFSLNSKVFFLLNQFFNHALSQNMYPEDNPEATRKSRTSGFSRLKAFWGS